MHNYSEKNQFEISNIFISVSFLALTSALLSSSLFEPSNIVLDEMIRGDGVGLSICLDDVI